VSQAASCVGIVRPYGLKTECLDGHSFIIESAALKIFLWMRIDIYFALGTRIGHEILKDCTLDNYCTRLLILVVIFFYLYLSMKSPERTCFIP